VICCVNAVNGAQASYLWGNRASRLVSKTATRQARRPLTPHARCVCYTIPSRIRRVWRAQAARVRHMTDFCGAPVVLGTLPTTSRSDDPPNTRNDAKKHREYI